MVTLRSWKSRAYCGPLESGFETARDSRNGLGRNRSRLEINACLYRFPVVIALLQVFRPETHPSYLGFRVDFEIRADAHVDGVLLVVRRNKLVAIGKDDEMKTAVARTENKELFLEEDGIPLETPRRIRVSSWSSAGLYRSPQRKRQALDSPHQTRKKSRFLWTACRQYRSSDTPFYSIPKLTFLITGPRAQRCGRYAPLETNQSPCSHQRSRCLPHRHTNVDAQVPEYLASELPAGRGCLNIPGS